MHIVHLQQSTLYQGEQHLAIFKDKNRKTSRIKKSPIKLQKLGQLKIESHFLTFSLDYVYVPSSCVESEHIKKNPTLFCNYVSFDIPFPCVDSKHNKGFQHYFGITYYVDKML